MKNNFFSNGFNNSTKLKLKIFDDYFNEALPVFIHAKGMKNIFICDFFAGRGMDGKGEFGTSLNIMETITNYCDVIIEKRKNIFLILNDKKEYDILKNNIDGYLNNCKIDCHIFKNDLCVLEKNKNLIIRNNDFKDYFFKVIEILKEYKKEPKIIFLDPFGLNFNDNAFNELINLPRTDFICFIPSSFIRRFKESRFFDRFQGLSFEGKAPNQCHKAIAEYFENKIPKNKEYYIGHFSIKNNRNYYGLIFGSNHIYGAEKFQNICWKIDSIVGEADYNIDHEPSYISSTLFNDNPLKIENLSANLEILILERQIKTNKDAYIFGLKNKCLPKHVTNVLKKMFKEKLIEEINTANSKIHKLEENEIKILQTNENN